MPATEFAVDVVRDADTAVLLLAGDISGGAETAFLDGFHATGEAGVVVLDFTSVEYINSSGIALIIQLLIESSHAGQTVYAFGLSAHFAKVFTMVGITKYARLFPSQAEALAAF